MPHETNKSALIWFSFAIILFWGSLYIYVPVLPLYAASLSGATIGTAGIVVSMYGLSQLVLRVPLGIFSDRLQRRNIFVLSGFILSLLAALGLGYSNNILGAAVFRALSGASAAMWVIISVLFASYFPQKAAVKATSFVVFLAVFAQMISSFFGGLITEEFGNKSAFFSAAILAVTGLLLFIFLNSITVNNEAEMDEKSDKFILHWSLIAVSLAAAVGQFITFATSHTYVPIYADKLGANSMQLGWLTAAMQFSYMITSLVISFLMPSKYEKTAAMTGMTILGLASLMILASSSVRMLLITRLLHGIGHGLSYPVLMGLAIKKVSNRQRATAMGIFQAIYAAGMFAGPAISGWISIRFDLSAVFISSGLLGIISLPILLFGI